MTRVACAPRDVVIGSPHDVRFMAYELRENTSHGHVGASIVRAVKRAKLAPSNEAWDFLSIALAVIAADEGCPRSNSADGWTRDIELTIAVANPPLWSDQVHLLQSALQFLTTDRWRLHFVEGGVQPTASKKAKPRLEDCVCLLSGGLDSFIGALDASAAGHEPLLVSQIAKGDKSKQRVLGAQLGKPAFHLQLNHNAVQPSGYSERSQRARSFIFLAYGVLAATCLRRYRDREEVSLYVPENGYISVNIPITPLRLASHSTRTTHPFYLERVQDVLREVGLRVRIVNPYQFKTKGEMLAECKRQDVLKRMAGSTTSCGRFARHAFKHCGRCVPCIIRRAAFQRWGNDPTAHYKYAAIGSPGPRLRDFDDVRSMAMACETVTTLGLEKWIGGGLTMVPPAERHLYVEVVQRGIAEVSSFLRTAGAL